MMKLDPDRLDLGARVFVVGDHAFDLHLQLAAALAPEQIEQAVVLARGHQRDAPALVRVGDPPVHREARRELAERGLEARPPGFETGEVERRAHEEGAVLGVGRVLVVGDDVRALLEQERRDRSNDARTVGARDQQPGGVLGAARRRRRRQAHQWLTAAAASSDTSRSS